MSSAVVGMASRGPMQLGLKDGVVRSIPDDDDPSWSVPSGGVKLPLVLELRSPSRGARLLGW